MGIVETARARSGPPPHVYHLPPPPPPRPFSRSLTDLVPRIFPSIVDRRPPSIRLRCFPAPLIRALFRVAPRLVIAREIGDASHKSVSCQRTPRRSSSSSSNLSAPSFLRLRPDIFPPFETRFNDGRSVRFARLTPTPKLRFFFLHR